MRNTVVLALLALLLLFLAPKLILAVGITLIVAGLAWGAWSVVSAGQRAREFGPELVQAVQVLSSQRRWSLLVKNVGLARVGVRAKGIRSQEEPVRFIPRVVGVLPAPFGAVATVVGSPGQDLAVWSSASGRLASALGVSSVVVREPESNRFQLELRARDPLSAPSVVSELPIPEGVSLILGTDESGQLVEMPLAGHSGLFVSGAPGSGKSAWLTSAIAGLSMYSDVQIVAIDGKHGHDLNALAPRCFRYLAGPRGADPLRVLMTLRDVQDLMNRRLEKALEWFGDSNYWTSGPHLDHPLLVVLIDEAQTYLDLRSALDRTEKDMLGEITSVTMDLVKKGRSAGILVCLATQKGTTDAIPSAIRDQCGLRVCFRVMTSEVAVAALGHLPLGAPSPVGQETGVGIAVSPSLAGVRFRAHFVPAAVIGWAVGDASDLTNDPGFVGVSE